MRIVTLMTILIVSLGMVKSVSGQKSPEQFFVSRITLDTDPNPPKFLWNIANIALQKYSNKQEIVCIEREFDKTGLFSKIESHISQIKNTGDYRLVFTLTYASPDPIYVVRKIDLVGYDQIDNSKFYELLASEHLVGKHLSLKTDYNEFSDKIFELVKKSMKVQPDQEFFRLPWIELKINENEEVEFRVMSEFRGCVDS